MADLTLALAEEDVERIAAAVAQRLGERDGHGQLDRWMTSAEAAEYLALPSVNALHRLSAERRLPASQDCPGGKLYFRRFDLDRWRASQAR